MLYDEFGEFCANGDRAVEYITEKISPWKVEHPDEPIILNFNGVKRLNSSFANALIGNIFALYGEDHIRIKLLDDSLRVFVLSALAYGESLRSKNETNHDKSIFERLLAWLKIHTDTTSNTDGK